MNDDSTTLATRADMLQVRTREIDPEEALAKATKWAEALMRVVKKAKISVNISGREYLKVEAWQTLARFNNCWLDTEWTRDITNNQGVIIGVEARARLMSLDTGQSLGGAEGSCMMDEELETRDGKTVERWSDYYAIKSMAQTRAQGKVGRMAYAWVAVLAGYEGTPAEEMIGRLEPHDQIVCPKCGKPSIIKGKAEYGGGWLCFVKKGGCGTKFTDPEWESWMSVRKGSTEPSAQTSQIPDTHAPQSTDPSTDRSILLGRIKGLADKHKLTIAYRADLWAKFCKGATPDTVDVAALQDLYAQLQKI